MPKKTIRKTFKKRARASSDLERSIRELNEALTIHKTLYNYKTIDAVLSELFELVDKASRSYTSLRNQALNIHKGIEAQLYVEEDVENVAAIFGLGLEDVDPFYYKDKYNEMEDISDQVSLIDVMGIDD
jgi:hypothetical protein